ncbi:hypothetical protein [Nesterenkonia suensis]
MNARGPAHPTTAHPTTETLAAAPLAASAQARGLALAVPLLGALLLSACAGGGEDQAPDPGAEPDSDIAQTDLDEPTGPEDGDEDGERDDGADGDTSLPEPTPSQVDEAPELVDEVLATWEDYEELSETELEVKFYSGNPSCYGVRSVVEEDAEEVRIATISGRLPEAGDQPCTQEALYVSVVVELEDPLGDREVVELQDVDLD